MAGVAITRAILAQPECAEQVQRLRAACSQRHPFTLPIVADCLACLYAQRGSLGHSVITHLLWTLADTPENSATLAAYVLWLGTAHINRSDRHNKPGDATVKQWERGAQLIARRGAGLCLTADCQADRSSAEVKGGPRSGTEYARRHYCTAHFDPNLNKADARAIENTFAAAHKAMASLGDLLWALVVPENGQAATAAPAGTKCSIETSSRSSAKRMPSSASWWASS